ncbi:MAG: amino acid permease [Candidatus Marinimicrobia bacterium]|nr:amino acid permease [Candidatus Neomarinimicrobiota bacterium]
MTHSEQTTGLRRSLTLLDSTMINVGTIIGSGIFLVPTTVALYLESSSLVLGLWIVAGIVTLFGALSVAELGAAMPKAGGQFVYLREAYGPIWGFLYGWATFAVINTGSIAAVAVAFASYFGNFVPLSPAEIKGVAISSIVFLTLLNCLGVKSGTRTQNLLTFMKVGALVGLVLVGLIMPGGNLSNFSPLFSTHSFLSLAAPLGIAMVAILWSYDGWIEITYVAGEVKNPGRNIPLSLLLSTLTVIAVYILVNFVYIYTLSIQNMAQSDFVAADSAMVVLGEKGGTLITIAILVSTFGANNGFILTGARIYYAMAKEGLFFQSVSRVHSRFRTPVHSLLLQGAWASVLTLTGTFEQLFTYVIFSSWFFYAMSCGAVLILRQKKPDLHRPYKTWGYPWVPIVFIVFAVWLTLNTIVNDPRDSVIGAGIILLGLPAYFYWKRKKEAME